MAARAELPSAFDLLGRLRTSVAEGRLALFFDYDGTLTPIVERPEDAVLAPGMRSRLERLARRCFIAVISGRGLADLRARVGIEGIAYAGSHGFELAEPDGRVEENPEAQAAIPALDAVEAALEETFAGIGGMQLERKRFGLAVHYRRVDPERVPEMERAVKAALHRQSGRLALKSGKKVWEFVPALDWDKGKALGWILDRLGVDLSGVLVVYFGDDVTDEDAFRAIGGAGIGIAVGDGPEETAATHRLKGVGELGRFLDALMENGEQQ